MSKTASSTLTRLALHYSRFTSAVARRHAEVSRVMFPGGCIDYITNGMNDAHLGLPRDRASSIPPAPAVSRLSPGSRGSSRAIRPSSAHGAAKQRLLQLVAKQTGIQMKPDVFTIGFARRAFGVQAGGPPALSDTDRLRQLAQKCGPLPDHLRRKGAPKDYQGKGIIQRIIDRLKSLAPPSAACSFPLRHVTCLKPRRRRRPLAEQPCPAPGSPRARAAGRPRSTGAQPLHRRRLVARRLREGITGWTIGRDVFEANAAPQRERGKTHAASIYEHLERDILPMYYKDKPMWVQTMRTPSRLNGSQFNSNPQ